MSPKKISLCLFETSTSGPLAQHIPNNRYNLPKEETSLSRSNESPLEIFLRE